MTEPSVGGGGGGGLGEPGGIAQFHLVVSNSIYKPILAQRTEPRRR